MLEKTVIKPDDDGNKTHYEVKCHLADIYLEELAKANNEFLDNSLITIFLLPYIKVSFIFILLFVASYYIELIVLTVR